MVYLLLTSILWALTYGITPRVLQQIPSLWLTGFYLFSGMITFLFWAKGNHPWRLRLRWMAMGAIQWGLMYFFLQQAFARLNGHLVALLCLTTPLYLALLADVFQRRCNWRRLLMASLAVGCAFMAVGGGFSGKLPWCGILCGEAANGCYALGQLLYQRFRRNPDHCAVADYYPMFWMFFGGFLVIALLWILTGMPPIWPEISTISLGAELLLLGPVCCGLGNFLWNRGIGKVSTTILLIFNNLSIPLGMLFSLIIFREQLQMGRFFLALVGMVLLLIFNASIRAKSP